MLRGLNVDFIANSVIVTVKRDLMVIKRDANGISLLLRCLWFFIGI